MAPALAPNGTHQNRKPDPPKDTPPCIRSRVACKRRARHSPLVPAERYRLPCIPPRRRETAPRAVFGRRLPGLSPPPELSGLAAAVFFAVFFSGSVVKLSSSMLLTFNVNRANPSGRYG